MEELTYIEKIAVVKVLNEILKADNIIHEKEIEYMHDVILSFGLKENYNAEVDSLITLQALSTIREMTIEAGRSRGMRVYQVQTGNGLHSPFPRLLHFDASGIRHSKDHPRFSFQHGFILYLETDNTLIIPSGKSQHLTCEGPVRVKSFVILIHLTPARS